MSAGAGMKGADIVTNMAGAVMAFQGAHLSAKGHKIEAQVYEEESDLALQKGFGTAQAIRRQADQFIGAITGAYAGAGVMMEGTPLLTLKESARRAELDVETAEFQGRLQQRRMLQSAEISRLEAKATKKMGSSSLLTNMF